MLPLRDLGVPPTEGKWPGGCPDSHLRLGNSQRQVLGRPQNFFGSQCLGVLHVSRLQRSPHAARWGADKSCSGPPNKARASGPVADNIRGKQAPKGPGKPCTPDFRESPSWGEGGLFLGPSGRDVAGRVGVVAAVQFLGPQAEVDYGRSKVSGPAEPRLLPPFSAQIRKPTMMKAKRKRKMKVVSRTSSHLKPLVARSSCCLRRASRRARKRRSRSSCSP